MNANTPETTQTSSTPPTSSVPTAAPAPARVDARTFAIGLLAVTASVLFVGLLLIGQAPARAAGTNDRGGDYSICTQQISRTAEAVAVIDGATRQMILYHFDPNTRRIELLQRLSLADLPRPQRSGPEPSRRK